MATRFEKMSTKKLNDIINDETTAEDVRTQAQAALDTRAEATTEATTKAPANPVLSAEEIGAKKADLIAKYKGHKVKYLPKDPVLDENGNVVMKFGVVVGVLYNPKSSAFQLGIETEDGKRIARNVDNSTILVTEEVVERTAKTRVTRTRAERGDWDGNAQREELKVHVGELLKIAEATDDAPERFARVKAIVPDSRACNCLLKCVEESVATDENGHEVVTTGKPFHRSFNADLVFIEDDKTQALREEYAARLAKEPTAPKTIEELEAEIKRRREEIEAKQAKLAELEAKLADMKAAPASEPMAE